MLLLAGCLWLLSGCGAEAPSEVPASQSSDLSTRDVPDPAMEPVPEPVPEITDAIRIDVLPTEITFDENNERIFIPEMGWMPFDEFWHIYETEPARLPANMDYKAVHQIRLSLADQDDDES